MNQHVDIEIAGLNKFLTTNFAFKWPLSSVDQHVPIKTIRSSKYLLTDFAVETHVSSLNQFVFLMVCPCFKPLFFKFYTHEEHLAIITNVSFHLQRN